MTGGSRRFGTPPRAAPRPPLVVLDVEQASALDEATERLRAAGWTVVDGVEGLPLRLEGLVCRALVSDERGASNAVLAASWGAGLLLGIGKAPADVRERLLDDLAHIGAVSRHPPPALPALHSDAARLLEALASGSSLGEAASALHLSRRTADRRLAEAKAQFGVRTTVEAIRRWRATAT